ncbi:hypothetical protein ABZ511_33060 [Nocardia gamkensis]|uniref:hypothetical protein n=1 Tax=Nocardia gamkensis TaxID=352869 RepID=UPI0033DC76EC
MKLLVTGGGGHIGGVVTHQLVDAGYEAKILDDLPTGFSDNLPQRPDPAGIASDAWQFNRSVYDD